MARNQPFILILFITSWSVNLFSFVKADGDYYASLIGVQKLVMQEHKIVEKLALYKRRLTETVEMISYFLDDYSHSISSILNNNPDLQPDIIEDGDNEIPVFKTDNDLEKISEQISANPIMVFKLFRRFAVDLDSIQTDLQNLDHHEDTKGFIQMISTLVGFPTLSDVTGAAQGLIRLQETYQLPTHEMGNGILIEKRINSTLLAADMLFIGVHAANQYKYATGMEWLYQAYQKVLEGDESLPLDVAKAHLFMGRNLHNTEFLTFRSSITNLFSNVINSNYSNIPELYIKPAIREYPLGHTFDTVYDVNNFNALCRGEQLLTPNETKSLRCWYSKTYSPLNILSPLKVELHNANPLIYQVYDLLPDKVIEHIKKTSLPLMKRSSVQGFNASERLVSDVRISSVSWLNDLNQQDNLLRQVPRYVKRATGLECENKSAAEELQVSCYGSVGGYYVPHLDTLLNPGTYRSEASQAEFNRRGDRVATTMFYLSDVELGGGTAFPRLGVAVKAAKGSAIIWYNIKLAGERDALTLHGGCPVLYGNKWVANKWIRLYDQMYIRKCGRSEHE